MYARKRIPREPRKLKRRPVGGDRIRPSAPAPPARYVDPPFLGRVSPEQVRLINRAHGAAMRMIHSKRLGGGCPDGELLLSYVVWPTERIVEALELAAA